MKLFVHKNLLLNRSKKNSLLFLLAFLLSITEMNLCQAQTLIAGWDFQTTVNGGTAIAAAPNTQTTLQANFGNGMIYLNGSNGSSTWVTANSGNQLTAFGGSNLNLGAGFSSTTTSPACMALVSSNANGKSIVFGFSMSGYSNLIVSYATQKTTTGFSSQQWDYSTDGISWTSFQTVSSIPSSFGVITLNSISTLNYASSAYLRMTVNGATNTSGNNRIDNVQFNATTSLPAPIVTNGSATATVGIPFSYFITASNLPISYAASGLPSGISINTSTGEISGTPTSFMSATSIPISATNYSGTGAGSLFLTVNMGTQTINFPSIPTKTVGDTSFNLNALGGASGNPVTYTSSNTAVATISGNTVNIVGAGTSVITASQAGNSNYLAANNVSQPLNVNQASQIILFGALPAKLITDIPFALSATGGSSGNPIVYTSSNTSVATVTGNTATITGAGSTIITASQSGNVDYLPAADVAQNLVVNQLTQTISFNPLPSKLINDPPFTVSATGGASGNPVTFASSNTAVAIISGNTVTIIGAGVTSITASQAGNTIYNAAQPVTQTLLVNSSSTLVMYTFGTASTPTALATAGVPVTNLGLSAISQGNNANVNQPSINLTTTSASTNSGSSGEMNAGITARNRSLQLDSSAYFEFTLTPSSGNTVTLNSINFDSRSTGTGPTTIDIRSSNDGYLSAASSINVSANSSWTFLSFSFSSLSATAPLTIRIYGYVTGGSGSISTGSGPNNWRIDDIKLNLSVSTSYACSLSVAATASPILCNGGSSTITVITTNANGAAHYRVNNGVYQTSNIFTNNLANTYTVSVSDDYLCYASTILSISEPTAVQVTAPSVTGCNGYPVTLSGYPAGGIFSIPNPYTGVSTTFTYSYTDSSGCTAVSSPANVTISSCAVLNLKLYFQSFYVGAGLMTPALYNEGVSLSQTIVDDITVELYDPVTFSPVASATTELNTDGTATISFPNLSGLYYIVIKHRNGLQTWSASPVTISSNTTYDFTTSANKVYGNDEVEVEPGVWAFYSGDILQDENIDLLDLPDVESDVQNFSFGYTVSDLNGDGNVDLLDFPILEDNIANFVYSDHPVFIVFPETMESGIKTTYPAADISLSTGSWNFDDALIGTSSSDRKNGAKSARIENTGKITMNFDVFIDSSVITVSHAKYASEANSTWALYISTNSGVSWSQQGSIITTSSTTLQSVSFVVNSTGNVRFQIRKLSGGRLNIDDFTISAPIDTTSSNDNDHLALGNPSGAVTDISFPDNYLLIKPQYDLAYNNSIGTASWVAWHLDLSDVGTTPRCDCFTTDMQLPSSFYRASSSSYTGTGFDRGHQVASSQRNNNITNNAVTFLMSNILPQAPNLNQITWSNLEQYCITLINNGYELYTYSGGYGSGGTGSNGGVTYTIDGGNITVPSHFWKIVVVLPVGNNDVSRVTSSTRVIAVDMPNTQTVNANAWGTYRTSVDAIEAVTGFDFLSNVSTTLQNTLEALVDSGPTN